MYGKLRQIVLHRLARKKKTINLLNINSNISDDFFFHIYSLGISKGGIIGACVHKVYIYIVWGHSM
jgi:hypothetical protein